MARTRSHKAPLDRHALIQETVQRTASQSAARIITGIVLVVTLIPALVAATNPDSPEVRAALGACIVASAWALFNAHLVSRDAAPRWIGLVNVCLYASFISGILWLFAARGAATSLDFVPVAFMLYFLLVGASSLRQDDRLPMVAGAVAAVQLVAVTVYAQLWAPTQDPAREAALLREFHWVRTVARIFLLFAATLLASSLARRGRLLSEQNVIDPLTGLLNRASFDRLLDRQLEVAQSCSFPVYVAMIDLDGFKELNDSRGHAMGDQVLRRVGRLLDQRFGNHELVGRYGGEEFAAAIPNASELHARGRIEALRREIEALRIPDPRTGEPVAVTFSAGLALWPDDGAQLGRVFRRADERLYAAKRAGRNRAEFGPAAA